MAFFYPTTPRVGRRSTHERNQQGAAAALASFPVARAVEEIITKLAAFALAPAGAPPRPAFLTKPNYLTHTEAVG